MDQSCCIHPEKKALSFCHNCDKYYCSDCLNEGKEFYYCNSEECLKLYEKDTVILKEEARKSNYADFGSRFIAHLIDTIILFVFNTILTLFLIFYDVVVDFGSLVIFGQLVIFGHPVFYVSFVLYFAIFESSSQQATIGKMTQKIVVVDYNGERLGLLRSFVRNISKFLSTILIFFGFIMALFTEKKQALHDIIAGSVILKLNNELLPEHINCKSCNDEVELNYKERLEQEFICPECNTANQFFEYTQTTKS